MELGRKQNKAKQRDSQVNQTFARNRLTWCNEGDNQEHRLDLLVSLTQVRRHQKKGASAGERAPGDPAVRHDTEWSVGESTAQCRWCYATWLVVPDSINKSG